MITTIPNSSNCIPTPKSMISALIPVLMIVFVNFISASHVSAQSSIDESVASESRGEFQGVMDTIYPDWFKLSFLELEEDVAEAAAEGKRLMLLFHQDGCPYCNAFVERNLAQKDIVDIMQSKLDVVELNMWGDREVASIDGKVYTEKEFAAALNVQFTPTILFLTEEGKLSLRINGYYNPDRFRVALDYVTQKLENTLSFNEYVEAQDKSTSSKELIARDYFTAPLTELATRPGKGQKPLILFFEQGSCRNCEMLHEKVLAQPASQELLAAFDSFQVNIWSRDEFLTPDGKATTGRQWSRELGVSYAPTLILYSKDGEEIIRSEAWFKTFHTQSILDYVVSEAWRDEPSFQRYISARAEEMRDRGIDVNIWD